MTYRELIFGATCVGFLMAAGTLPTPTEMGLSEKVKELSLTDVGLPEAPVIMSNVTEFIEKLPEVAAQIDTQLFRGTPAAPVPVLPANLVTTEAVALDRMVNFDFDVSTLDASARDTLAQIAGVLVDNPNAQINIFGHTDLTGSEDYNETLGLERAERVAAFLILQGVPSDQFKVIKSFGEEMPIVRTTGPERLNRRVNIETM